MILSQPCEVSLLEFIWWGAEQRQNERLLFQANEVQGQEKLA